MLLQTVGKLRQVILFERTCDNFTVEKTPKQPDWLIRRFSPSDKERKALSRADVTSHCFPSISQYKISKKMPGGDALDR